MLLYPILWLKHEASETGSCLPPATQLVSEDAQGEPRAPVLHWGAAGSRLALDLKPPELDLGLETVPSTPRLCMGDCRQLGGSEMAGTCLRSHTSPPLSTLGGLLCDLRQVLALVSDPGALGPTSACLDLSSDFHSRMSKHVAFTGRNCELRLPSVRSGLITSQTGLGFQH